MGSRKRKKKKEEQGEDPVRACLKGMVAGRQEKRTTHHWGRPKRSQNVWPARDIPTGNIQTGATDITVE